MLTEVGRDLVHRTLGPLAARMPGVNPNVLTAGGLVVACLAGFAFYLTDRYPAAFLAAAGLCCVYGFLDALDGIIARAHGKTTALGDFLDHTFDRISATVVLTGLALTEHANAVLMLVVMLGTLWHGFLGTQIEASFGTRMYRGVGVAEALLVAFVYSITAYWIRATGLPFDFREPFTDRMLSVTDAFALLALFLVLIGTVQRFLIARDLAARSDGRPRGDSRP